jgi:hypothetical protein
LDQCDDCAASPKADDSARPTRPSWHFGNVSQIAQAVGDRFKRFLCGKGEEQAPDWQVHGNTAQRKQARTATWALRVATIGAITAACGVGFGVRSALNQLQETRGIAAKRLFGDYLRLAIERPDLSQPNYSTINTSATTLIQYQAFLWNLLYACDELAINNLFSLEGWRQTCQHHLERHALYLGKCENIEHPYSYSVLMKELMKEVADAALHQVDPVKLPKCSQSQTMPALPMYPGNS